MLDITTSTDNESVKYDTSLNRSQLSKSISNTNRTICNDLK